jgi:hypothetical protein
LRPYPVRSHLFAFKVSDEERAMLEYLAHEHGETMSQTVRRLLRQALQGHQPASDSFLLS